MEDKKRDYEPANSTMPSDPKGYPGGHFGPTPGGMPMSTPDAPSSGKKFSLEFAVLGLKVNLEPGGNPLQGLLNMFS
jgi:hypothetical protein